MANTNVSPDFFSSPEECENYDWYGRKNTNPRYAHFKQTHTTAGDIDQFRTFSDREDADFNSRKNTIEVKSVFGLSTNFSEVIAKNLDFPFPEQSRAQMYKDHTEKTVMDTFLYLYHKFKKGIYVRIQGGAVKVFLPFSKKNFVNEWADRVQIDPAYGSLNDFLKKVAQLENRKFYPNSVNQNKSEWYANNCLVRYETPIQENDTNIAITRDMLVCLCRNRKIPDIEFFVNRRDFPVLRANGMEAYDHIFGWNQPLLSHAYTKYTPILGMTTTNAHTDIPIPTVDDWNRISRMYGKFFPRMCRRDVSMDCSVPFTDRIDKAVFRGSSTGAGFNLETNLRLKLAKLGMDEKNKEWLDAGITKWNVRPRKHVSNPYLQTIDYPTLGIELKKPLTPSEQCKYKYIITVDGHSSAFRLSLELGSGSVILRVDSPYKLWYNNLLKAWTHYIPVKDDLSDLHDQVTWCRKNPEKAETIAKNAREFFDQYLSEDGMYDYLQGLLVNLHKQVGPYRLNPISIGRCLLELETQEIKQERILENNLRKIGHDRKYRELRALQRVIVNTSESVLTGTKQTRNTTIAIYAVQNHQFIGKTSHNDLTHEFFVGLRINRLLQDIPNFPYTFSLANNELRMERIPGKTLFESLHELSDKDLTDVLVQITLAIAYAHAEIGFVHNDLAPWNIILLENPTKTSIHYPCQTFVSIITPRYIPILIDFGKSSVIHKDLQYTGSDYLQLGNYGDLFSMIVHIADLLLAGKRNTFANFLVRFLEPECKDIQAFTNRNKKYEVLSNMDFPKKDVLLFLKYLGYSNKKSPIFTSCMESVPSSKTNSIPYENLPTGSVPEGNLPKFPLLREFARIKLGEELSEELSEEQIHEITQKLIGILQDDKSPEFLVAYKYRSVLFTLKNSEKYKESQAIKNALSEMVKMRYVNARNRLCMLNTEKIYTKKKLELFSKVDG